MKKETQPRLCKLYTIRIKCLWPILTSTHGAQIEIFKYCFSLKGMFLKEMTDSEEGNM